MDIRGLAKHLDLSIGTVSRALNGRKDVSEDTRRRVASAAAALGYAPNHAGRSLRSGRMGAVGFVLTLEHDEAIHGAPFFMSIFEGVQRRLSEEEIDLIVLLARHGEDGLSFLQRHVSRRIVDGWVLSATERDDARIEFLLDRDIPFVALGRSGASRTYNWIDLDFEGVASHAMAKLLADGHRRIGLITPHASLNNSHVTVQGYRDALDQAGIDLDAGLISYGDVDERHGEEASRSLVQLAEPPTALLVMGETAPVGVYRGLRSAGFEPGQDVAVIGLRNAPAAETLEPPLSSFAVKLEDLGAALGDVIAAQLAPDPASPLPAQRRWPMELMLRGSERWRGGRPSRSSSPRSHRKD